MFAYVDETGNTGSNLFDPAQPTFMTSALLTKKEFDFFHSQAVKKLAAKLGVDALHANELGLTRIEAIAADLLQVITVSGAQFLFCVVKKPDLAATKLFDTLFDSGENFAVPWHAYNVRPLRLLLLFKVTALLDENLTKRFWSCLMELNKDRAVQAFVEVVRELAARVGRLPDARSRQIVSEGFQWALDNPDAIYFHSNSKSLRRGHLPNMVAFPDLLRGIDNHSKKWKKKVEKIIHDRQSEFGASLREWHTMYSNAKPDPLFMPLGEVHYVRRVAGSDFLIMPSPESAGLQVADVILWLFKQVERGVRLQGACSRLMQYAFNNSLYYEFSLQSMSDYLHEFLTMLQKKPLTDENLAAGQKLLDGMEARRQENMAKFQEEKMRPRLAACGYSP